MMAGQEGFRIRGDFDLAVMNSYTLSGMASAGFLSAMLSPELTFADIREMPKCMDAELAIYGRLPVMVTQTCLLKASAGRCTCTTPGQMADTRGGVWPVTKHFGCRNTVWAARKLLARRRDAGVDRSRSLGGAAMLLHGEHARMSGSCRELHPGHAL